MGYPNRYVTATIGPMARRFRERRAAGIPTQERRPPRPARWAAALAELRALQAEYKAWRDQLPESLADSRTAELLDGVLDVDLDAVDVELPRGFGRDLNATAHDAAPPGERGIPPHLTAAHIKEAMQRIIRDGIPRTRRSRLHCLVTEDGRHLPPKYTISLAHQVATGKVVALGPIPWRP